MLKEAEVLRKEAERILQDRAKRKGLLCSFFWPFLLFRLCPLLCGQYQVSDLKQMQSMIL